jgi:hypothetical protein
MNATLLATQSDIRGLLGAGTIYLLLATPLLFCALVARHLAKPSGRTTLGFWLGLLLGPIGVLTAAVIGLRRPRIIARRRRPVRPPVRPVHYNHRLPKN